MDASNHMGVTDAPDFFATASHELRTPLTGVLGYLELVLEDDHLAAEHRRHLETAHRCGHRLLRAVEELLVPHPSTPTPERGA